MNLSVVIPAHNEERTIAQVVEAVLALSLAPEVIVVDDGSTDGTVEALARLECPRLRVVRLERNAGKGAAVRAGLEQASGVAIALHDADLELDPAALASLAEPVLSGRADAALGIRCDAHGKRLLARLANWLLTSLANRLLGTRLADIACGQRVVRGDLLRGLGLEASGFELEAEMAARLALAGARIVEFPVPYHPRGRAQGKKTRYLRDGWRACRALMRVRGRVRRAAAASEAASAG